jgi:hypothetical protein
VGAVLRLRDENGNIQSIPALKGDNATINGVNTLTIKAGDNVVLSQDGDTLTISFYGSSSSGSSTDLTALVSKLNELETALANKQDKIENWGDLKNG